MPRWKRTPAIDRDLYPYQRAGVDFLAARRFALLADEMGLGKSAQAVVASDRINAERILVICPASVRINWTREYAKFSTRPLTMRAVLTGSDVTRCLRETANGGLLACSYDLATQKEPNALLRSWLSNGHLLLDEVHFLKSVEAQRSHAVLGRGGLVHSARRTWALSGTPAPNHLAELWPLLRVFGATRDSYDQHVARFCRVRHTRHGDIITGNKNIPEFRQLIHPWILRRLVKDVMPELPPIRFEDVTVPAGEVDEEVCFPEYFMLQNRRAELHAQLAKQREGLQGLFNLAGAGVGGTFSTKTYDAIATMMTGPGPISTLRRYVGLQRVQGVVDLVKDELESGLDKIVIFAIHRDVIENLRVGLAKYGAVTLYGGTNPTTKQRNIDKFAKNPKCRVFIGNLQAAGTGVDGLQNQCCNVLLVEKYGVPGVMAQAIMRVRRNGQTRPVLVRSVKMENDDLFNRVEETLYRRTRDLVAAFD